MTKTYLITLTPTGKFFFGGEMKFQIGGEKNKDEQFDSYIIKSNRLPQQTSLLGMLRFLLLKNAGDRIFSNEEIKDKIGAKGIIGAQSFKVNEDNSPNDFGLIKRIHPCFIMDGNTPLSLFVLNTCKGYKKADASVSTINNESIAVPSFVYNPKESQKDPYDGVFKEDMRMGIDKDYSGKPRKKEDEGHLFKQESLRFTKDTYKFAFYAEVEDENLSNYNNQLVSLGADSSLFIIGIEESEIKDADKTLQIENTIVLTSPTYVESSELTNVSYAITDVIPFRFLSTSVDTTTSYVRKKDNGIVNSKKFNLYNTGSIFFFNSSDERDKFAKALNKHQDFQQIGYNQFYVN